MEFYHVPVKSGGCLSLPLALNVLCIVTCTMILFCNGRCVWKKYDLLGCSFSIICVTEVIFFNFLQHIADFPVICHLWISTSLLTWEVVYFQMSSDARGLLTNGSHLWIPYSCVCVNHASRADSSFSSCVSLICVGGKGSPVICNFLRLAHSVWE
jgi:hypothetical protein